MPIHFLKKLRLLDEQVLFAWYAFRHPATPLPGKLMLLLIALYLLSPVDLIPDTFPILGWLDDVALVSLGLPLILKLLPSPVRNYAQAAADAFIARIPGTRKY